MLETIVFILICAHVGILIEFWFTGLYSLLVQKDKRASCYSYLHMLPVYAGAGFVLGYIRDIMNFPWWTSALIYVFAFYFVEAIAGSAIKIVAGEIPWTYPKAWWTLGGRIQPKYAPFWLLLAICLDKLLEVIGAVASFLVLTYTSL